jgi:hypothetical protein
VRHTARCRDVAYVADLDDVNLGLRRHGALCHFALTLGQAISEEPARQMDGGRDA